MSITLMLTLVWRPQNLTLNRTSYKNTLDVGGFWEELLFA